MFKLTMIAAALCVTASAGTATSALAQKASHGALTSVVVLPFAAMGSATSPASGACVTQGTPPSVQDLDAISTAVESGLASQLTNNLAGRLRDHGGVTVYGDGQAAPSDALTVSGCILRADPGDPAKRIVGLGLGASVLAVHVQVYRGGQTGLDLIDEFDTEVQGENKLPPIGPVGLAVHGIRGQSLTLKADADKLAGLIAQRVLTGRFAS